MPVTMESIKAANDKLRSNTNRGILLTTVNLATDAPRISDMLSDLHAGVVTWEQFSQLVKQKLTVRSFDEFLTRFKPCFYYRLVPGRQASASVEDAAAMAEQNQGFAVAASLPEYEFSLEGGPAEQGWRTVLLTRSHPLIKNLELHLREKALASATNAQIQIDDALWGFKPETIEQNLKKSAKDLKTASEKLMLEMKRDPKSPDTRRALEAYDARLDALESAVGDDLQVLPAIASGLAQARKALGSAGNGAGPAPGAFMLELGERARLIAHRPDPAQSLKALPGAPTGCELVLLQNALESRPLVRREVKEIAALKPAEQFPALVGTFMSEMVRLNKVQPALGNMLAVVLQDPKQLASWDLNPAEVDVFHDTFLGVYSMSVERFLAVIVPLLETVMGVFALFNEFPYDVRRGQPELIVANDELTDLWRIYNDEISSFLRQSCLQAANQYQDAISFALVPSVAPFKGAAPVPPPASRIRAGSFVEDFYAPPMEEEDASGVNVLRREFEVLRKQNAGTGGGFGRVAGAGEVQGLMQLGKECGFSVFFSPNEKVVAGRTRPEYLSVLQDNYCPDAVVDKDWAVAGVLCLPDFVCIPPDGMLFTGKVTDGRSVGVEVPQIVVRGCFAAAGRIMANDNPDVLRTLVQRLGNGRHAAGAMKINPNLPGVGLDLTRYPALGKTNLAPDHFLSDSIVRTLTGRDRSFLTFSHVAGQSPHIALARTLRRVRTDSGERYVLLHHWRQQVYLLRLFYAAYHLGFEGAWPNVSDMAALMDNLVKFSGWYDTTREGIVNSFPGELVEDRISVDPVQEAGETVGYILDLKFQEAVLGPLELTIG